MPSEAVGGLVDRPVAAERHDDVRAAARGGARQAGRVAGGVGVDGLDVEAARECGDDEAPQARRRRSTRTG